MEEEEKPVLKTGIAKEMSGLCDGLEGKALHVIFDKPNADSDTAMWK
jgi:hypothetical protein